MYYPDTMANEQCNHALPPLKEGRRMVSFDDGRRVEEDIDRALADIPKRGFNTVLFCITGTDLTQRTSAWPGISTVTHMQQEAKRRGLYVGVNAWKMGNRMGGESISNLAPVFIDRTGRITHAPKSDPFGREFRESWLHFLDVSRRGGADFVFIDEPNMDDTSTDAFIDFIGLRTQEAHEDAGLRTDVCLTVNHLEQLGARVLALPHVDALSTDPIYGGGPSGFSKLPGTNHDSPEQYVGGNAAIVRRLGDMAGKQAGVIIQGHSISAGHEETVIRGGIEAAARYVDNIGYWETTYSNIRPVNPALARQVADEAFQKLGS